MLLNIFILILFVLPISKSNNNEENEKTCEETEEYKIQYDDYFIKEEQSLKEFNFILNVRIIDYIKENNIITYPKHLFRGNLQGNYLHFIYLAYNKKLPIYFTLDQIIYPYIEITKDIIQNIFERGIYQIFYDFLKNIIEKIKRKPNYDEDLLTYFEIGFKLLNPQYKEENNSKNIDNIIQNILNAENNNNNSDINNYYNFTLFGYERNINKMNFVKINPLFNSNIKSKRLFHCISFFQNFVFNIRYEIYNIYLIGKIIDESNQKENFKKLKSFFKYIFNEEENLMNPLEIYEYINDKFPDKNKTKEAINFNLYYKIKDNIIKNRTFSFMSDFKFDNEREEIEFNNQLISKISLFSYSYNVKDWINYKLLNINKMRLFPSLFEYITLVHNSNKMKNLIMNRYNYGNNKTDIKQSKMLKFRDGVNMENEFNEAKEKIDKSMIYEKEKWEHSYKNSFNYLLNIIGSSNQIYENNPWEESKIFNTLIGSYIHFDKDFLLYSQLTLIEDGENGKLIDVYFEENIPFYEELKKITLIFKKYSIDIINTIKNESIKEELEKYTENKLNKLFIAYENILKGIKYQNDNYKEEERIKIIDKLFYYNKENKKYEGWYVDLYKINNDTEIDYNLNIYVNNYYVSNPIKELNFDGSIIFGAMNYPQYGVIAIKDKINKIKKLYIFSFYSGNEYPHSLTDEIDFNSLKRLIIKR